MFLGPHKMKMSHYFITLSYPLELGPFLISPPPPNFELFPTETCDFFDIFTTPPPSPLFGPQILKMLSKLANYF